MRSIPEATILETTASFSDRKVWHVFRGSHFIGAFTKEDAEALVARLNAEKAASEGKR